MRTGRTIQLFWIVALAAFLGACSHDNSDTTLRGIAATFVSQDAAERLVAPNLPWVQISYSVRRPWLEFAVDESRFNEAARDGWKLCRPKSAEWDGYEDHAVTSPNYRRIRTYVLYKDGISVQLIGIYDTPLDTMGLGKRDEKPIQHGIVVATRATVKEALQTAANFQLSCDVPSAKSDGSVPSR